MPLPLAEEQLKEEGGQGLGKQRGGWAARRHRQPGLSLTDCLGRSCHGGASTSKMVTEMPGFSKLVLTQPGGMWRLTQRRERGDAGCGHRPSSWHRGLGLDPGQEEASHQELPVPTTHSPSEKPRHKAMHTR